MDVYHRNVIEILCSRFGLIKEYGIKRFLDNSLYSKDDILSLLIKSKQNNTFKLCDETDINLIKHQPKKSVISLRMKALLFLLFDPDMTDLISDEVMTFKFMVKYTTFSQFKKDLFKVILLNPDLFELGSNKPCTLKQYTMLVNFINLDTTHPIITELEWKITFSQFITTPQNTRVIKGSLIPFESKDERDKVLKDIQKQLINTYSGFKINVETVYYTIGQICIEF